MKKNKNAHPTARRVYKRGMQKRVGKMSGIKFPGIIQLESQMEGALVRCMQIDPRVVALRPQPCTIDMRTGRVFPNKEALRKLHEGKHYKPKAYTPDLQVELESGAIHYLDAKHTNHIKKNPEFLEYPERLRELGLSLSIVTEELLQGPIDRNAWLLLEGQKVQIRPADKEAVLSIDADGVIFRDATQKHGIPLSAVLKLILEGFLTVDLTKEVLSPRTVLLPSNGDKSHLEIVCYG